MRRGHRLISAVTFLLVCFGIYGSLYSLLLVWNKNDLIAVGQGFQTRTVFTADQIVQVAFITQKDRLPGAVALINSIVSNTKHPVHFYIITDNDTVDVLWQWIENSQLSSISYQLTGVTVDWILKHTNVSKDGIKPLSYARLLFPKIFPTLKNRVIFLDDDIVVQGDINELFHVPIKRGHVGAFSSDCDARDGKYKNQGNQYGNLIYIHKLPLRGLRLNSSACTFSLGVGVIDVQKWNELNISQEALHWIQVNKKTKLYKGDGVLPPLLIALHNKISHLEPNWHVRNLGLQVGFQYEESLLSQAKLLQWNRAHKPWTKGVANSDLWSSYFVPDPSRKYSLPYKTYR